MELRIADNLLEEIEGITHEYPYIMHHIDQQDFYIPWHWHEEVEFCYIEKGEVEVTTPNKVYTFQEHEAFFTNTNILCTMKSLSPRQPCIIDSHLFHPVLLGGHFKSIFYTKYLDPVLKNTRIELVEFREKEELHRKVLKKLTHASALQAKEHSEFQIRNEFSEIWILLMEIIQNLERSGKGVTPASQDRIQTMLTFIHLHYPDKITLEDIAASALVSKRECLRCFQNSIKKSPFEYLMEYRIQAAEKLLRTSDETITEIALKTGFSNSSYFGKVFKQTARMTPQDYRNQHRRNKS